MISSLLRLQRLSLSHLPRHYKSIFNSPLLILNSNLSPPAYSTTSAECVNDLKRDNYHKLGSVTRKKFEAETKKLLDIVAKSLYSDKEVFLRELVSNCNDAIERLRFLINTGKAVGDRPLEIHLTNDEPNNLLIIQDTGIGMTKEEMESNLGTIAKSGSRDFLSEVESDVTYSKPTDIIGQFGVGFYASFMVADKVEVYSVSQCLESSQGHIWSSDGQTGDYEISSTDYAVPGTKIVLHLKPDCKEFSRSSNIERILKKYSNFISTPIFLNGERINLFQPIWLKDPSLVTDDDHVGFYQFICSNTYDTPRYSLLYRADAPINLRALLYIPSIKPSIFDMAKDVDSGISLYSKKVLILNKAPNILPKWLRFIRGIVDSEDIPLNLSRELLQDHALIHRINRLLTTRALRFLSMEANKDKAKFALFYNDFNLYLKEGIVLENEQSIREEIAKLLLYETSSLPKGQFTTLEEYGTRMDAGSRIIYYLSAPNRQLAESSPYLEALRQKKPGIEVIFLYEAHDELVLMQLGEFAKKKLVSVENALAEDSPESTQLPNSDSETKSNNIDDKKNVFLTTQEAKDLAQWCEKVLGKRVKKVVITSRLTNHPCLVTVREAGAMRHFLRTTLVDRSAEERNLILEPILELNPCHDLVIHLHKVIAKSPSRDPGASNEIAVAESLLEHLLENGLAQAGLLDDLRNLSSKSINIITQMVRLLNQEKICTS